MKHLELTALPTLDYKCEEELNTLCTNLSFYGRAVKRIMVTSCIASEGKSFITMNMMRTLASLGKRVALVDADLRRSMTDASYGVRYMQQDASGLTHYLAGLCELDEALYSTNIPGTLMVPVGHEVSNSLLLLNSERFTILLDRLSEIVDFVLVDAPPVGVIIDAAEIAKSCDGTLFVVQYNSIGRRQLLSAKQQIERTGCMILGAVLNNVTMDTYSSKHYYGKTLSSYNSYYGASYQVHPEKDNEHKQKPPRPTSKARDR